MINQINWTNAILCYIILGLGLIAVLGSAFILLVIGKSKALRNNLCTLLIGILAISDFCSGKSGFIVLFCISPYSNRFDRRRHFFVSLTKTFLTTNPAYSYQF